MAVKITEVTRDDRATFGMRMQQTREARNMSRRALAEATGIPVKSVEKFEAGVMSPNVERLQAIADALEVSTLYLLQGDEADSTTAAPVAPPAAVDHNDFETADLVSSELAALDAMRLDGFQNFWRSAPRSLEATRAQLDMFSYDELLDLAEERGLLAVPAEEIEAYETLTADEQNAVEAALAERIMDTACFGVDLFKLALKPLEELAEGLELEGDEEGWFSRSWSGHTAIIAMLRPHLREQALKGTAPDFTNLGQFPHIEAA